MRRLQRISAGLAIASEALALTHPPGEYGIVVDADWVKNAGYIAQFDLFVWANAVVTLTDAYLAGAISRPFTIAATDIDSTTHGSELINEASHGLLTGDGPIQLTTSDTLPTGLSLLTDYWVIKNNANSFKLATSLALALAGTVTAFSSAGTGTHTYTGTASCRRLWWMQLGKLLGIAEDGEIALDVDLGYVVRREVSPAVVAYALVASMSASDPEWVSAELVPVVEA